MTPAFGFCRRILAMTLFLTLLLWGASGCKQHELFPEYIEGKVFSEENKEFLAQYIKIYASSMHKEGEIFEEERGKVLIAEAGEHDYQVAFYRFENGGYRRIGDPVSLPGVEKPYASEFLGKKVPCIVAQEIAEPKTHYIYVYEGRVNRESI